MKRPLYFALIIFAVCVGSVGALFSWIAPILVLLCFVFRAVLARSASTKALSATVQLALFLCCVVGELTLNWGQSGFLRFSAGMLLYVFCLRTFQHERSGERMQVGVISLLPIAVLAYRSEVWISLSLLLVFIILYAAHLMEQTGEKSSAGLHFGRTRSSAWRRLSRVAKGYLLFTLLAGAGVFLVLPRFGNDLANPAAANPRSAYNEGNLDLQKSGRVQSDPMLLFSADLPANADGYYWRMQTQSSFDGKRWLADAYVANRQQDSAWTQLLERLRSYQRRRVTLEFTRPWPHTRIPSLAKTHAIEPVAGEGFAYRLAQDSASNWFRINNRRSQSLMGYSLLWEDSERILDSGEKQLNSKVWPYGRTKEPKITDLANKIVGAERSPLIVAALVSEYLKSHYHYSLDLPERGQWPVSDFLFEQKSGHCEVFAASMAALLSTLELRSRLVTGYYSAEVREGRNFVRNAHAHAWVEVYDGAGAWHRFDPTASSAGFSTPSAWVIFNDRFTNYRNSILFRYLKKHWPKAILMLLMCVGVSLAFSWMRCWPRRGCAKCAYASVFVMALCMLYSIWQGMFGLFIFCLHPLLFLGIVFARKAFKPELSRQRAIESYLAFISLWQARDGNSELMASSLESQRRYAVDKGLDNTVSYLDAYASWRFGADMGKAKLSMVYGFLRNAKKEVRKMQRNAELNLP
ncbi:MAG: DUF3488 and transglutaminase-like domain-containing protein [Bradymonadales bacterium]